VGDGDQLAVNVGGTSILGVYNAGSETLTLTGSDTLAHYQQVLDSLTFVSTSSNPDDYGSNPTRTVTWVLNDGSGSFNLSTTQTETVSITRVNDPPTLTSVVGVTSYTENAAPITVSPSITVSDPDNLTLANATVSISNSFAGDGDVLATNTAGTSITASYNSATETLTLSGTDTLAHYQQVLDSVTFSTPSDNPTDYGSNLSRVLTWTVNDGSASNSINAPQFTTVVITAVNDAPTLSNVATSDQVTFPGQTVTVSPSAVVSDPDNLKLASATVAITGGFSGDGDVLSANVSGTSITASYNAATEVLTLTGSDTLAHYQSVLDSVTFNSTSSNPTNFGNNRTRTVSWTLNDGSGSNNLSTPATTTISFQGVPPFDFNGDVISDLVFQNEAFNAGPNTGTPQIWLWNGTAVTSQTTFPNPGATWHIITSRDVNGDGKADLIWQNNDGTPGIWLMNGLTPITEVGLANPGANWHLVASGDLNGDGRADLIWQESGGQLGVWLMNGTTPIAEAGINNPGPTWKVVGAADFNADGRDDILLQNTVTGNLMVEIMNGTSVASSVTINVGDPSWHAVSTGTFNGITEIAWQNNDLTPGIWLFNGTTPIAEAALQNPGPGWKLISVDHFTPDGNADLLFQNTSGAMGLWELNGTTIISESNLPNPGTGQQSENGHPFTNSGFPNTNGAQVTNGNGALPSDANGALSNNGNGALPTDANGTMHQSTPDAANAASVLNGSDPQTGSFHLSAPDLGNAAAGTAGAPGAPVFGAGAMAPSQTQLASSDPNLMQ
jgi:FG-GAP-like repeat